MKKSDRIAVERAAIEEINAARNKAGMSVATLAQAALAGEKSPVNMLKSLIYKTTDAGKPLRLRLGDYVALCSAVGIDSVKLLHLIKDNDI